jgi:hypothetical protein
VETIIQFLLLQVHVQRQTAHYTHHLMMESASVIPNVICMVIAVKMFVTAANMLTACQNPVQRMGAAV